MTAGTASTRTFSSTSRANRRWGVNIMKSNHQNITTMAPVARIGVVCTLIATALLACILCVPQAFAKQTIEMPDGWGVSDDITRIHVTKVDAGTHEALKGAKMVIIERDTGAVVDEWTTDGTTHETEKLLDVNKEYILRELEAPEGYEKAQDTIFEVNEIEGTGITIKDPVPSSTELAESYKVTIYDQHVTIVKEEEVVKRSPKTGDDAPLILVGVLGGVTLVAIAGLQFLKRRIKD